LIVAGSLADAVGLVMLDLLGFVQCVPVCLFCSLFVEFFLACSCMIPATDLEVDEVFLDRFRVRQYFSLNYDACVQLS
jgi:hypothetical protein